jgi:tetratricopeptide (TPR) repeat protein
VGRSKLSLSRTAGLVGLAVLVSLAVSAIGQPESTATQSAAGSTSTLQASPDRGQADSGTTTAQRRNYQIGNEWRARLEASGYYPEDIFRFYESADTTADEQRELKARDHYFVAQHYLETGEQAHALGEFRAALELDPGNTMIMLGLGEAHIAAKEFDQAERMIDQILEKEPEFVDALIYRAQMLLTRSEQLMGAERKAVVERAIATLEEAKRIQPRNMEVLKTLAAAHVAAQDITRIIGAYRDILSVNPRDTYSLLILANVLSKIPGRQEEAIPYYERVIEQRRGFINTYVYLAQLYQDLGRMDDALATYKQGILIDPRNEQLLRGFDTVLLKVHGARGGQQAVLRQYERFAKDFPYSSEIQRLYGDKLAVSKNTRGAIQQYKRVLELDSENVDALIAIGNMYMQLGNIDEATRHFSKAVDINPEKVEVYEAIAEALNEKDPAKAVEIYRKAVQLNPKEQKLYLHLAALLDKQEKTPEAIEVLEQARERAGSKAETLTMLGLLYEKQKDNQKAFDTYKDAYSGAPQNRFLFAKMLSMLIKRADQAAIAQLIEQGENAFEDKLDLNATVAETYLSEGQRDKAAMYYEKALQQDPNKLSLYASLVHISNLANNYAKSLELIERARATFGNTDAVDRMHAETLMQKRDFAAAAEVLKAFVERKPDSLDAYRLLADALTKDNKYDEAIAVVKQAEQRLGKSDDIDSFRGITLYQQKRYDQAEKIFKDLAQRELGRPQGRQADDYYYFLGSIYLEQKRFDAAERAFRRAIQLNPQNDNALNALGYMLAENNVKLPEAKKLVERALELNPTAPHILDSLGWVYFKMGDIPQARELIERAANLMGDDAEILDHLGDIYAASGDIPKALQFWKRSLSIDQTRVAVKEKISNHER